jgi:transposase-like protein
MFEAGITAGLYQIQGKDFDCPDMTTEPCPQCKGDYLKKHGYYDRYLITVEFEGEIKIKRYYCPACKKTVSLLPSFCHPKRTYGTEAIILFLKEYYDKIIAVCRTIINILQISGMECSRQLLRHYRRRMEKNLTGLIMAITDAFGLRAPPVTERTNTRERVRQFLSKIRNPSEDSLKIFERTRTTYLTLQPN